MVVLTPPVIVSATIQSGTPLSVRVEWTGEPRVEPTYQWFNGTRRIRDATGPEYAGTATSCRVQIDNGVGAAGAVAIIVNFTPPPDPEAPDLGDLLGFLDDAPLIGFLDDAPLEAFLDA